MYELAYLNSTVRGTLTRREASRSVGSATRCQHAFV
jgi:hypothetical protein